MLKWSEIEINAIAFKKRWGNCEGNEDREAQIFERDFMSIFGIDWRTEGLTEYHVYDKEGRLGKIDYLLPGKILIEMKSKGESLILAYNQAIKYAECLMPEEKPELIMVCDFETFQVTNIKIGKKFNSYKISMLEKHCKMFGCIAGYTSKVTYETNIDVNTKASYKMAKLHKELENKGYSGEDLEIYLVRLLFCLFAEDTGIFEEKSFENYVTNSKEDGSDLSARIMQLFSILNIAPRKRMTNLPDELKNFRYINGGIFAKPLPPAFFDAEMRNILIECCKFNWSHISPAIFGSMFQGVMDEEERRHLGAHYTSEENILSVIKPVFLDDLWSEFDKSKFTEKELNNFHNKIANLKFLDPACGCGNFLIIAYRELRLLEFEILKLLYDNSDSFIIDTLCKVSINQFYGIEYGEFACQIAHVGMILMKHQMDKEISNYFGFNLIDFPISESATIVHGNSLKINWENVVSKKELSYIIGNPPFSGGRRQQTEQSNDIKDVAYDFPKNGNLDYVAAWYILASRYIQNTNIKVGFVSTSSITQGEQVSILWKKLFNDYGIEIIYAIKAFVWHNEAKNNAGVHCVIIIFHNGKTLKQKYIVTGGVIEKAQHINAYLLNTDDIWISSRKTPLFDSPNVANGNKPLDNAICAFTPQEKEEFVRMEPDSEPYFYRYMGSREFLNNIERYFLVINKIPLHKVRHMPLVIKKLQEITEYRKSSKSKQTRALANSPSKFHIENFPEKEFLVIPGTLSGNYALIPVGFLPSNVMVNNKLQIMKESTLYEFGILSSSIHNIWIELVSGRFRGDFTYSVGIDYNTFPFPSPTSKQKERIAKASQVILNIKNKYFKRGDCLADLYKKGFMPEDLIKAHKSLDKEVSKAYGKTWKTKESCLDDLIKMYYNKLCSIH